MSTLYEKIGQTIRSLREDAGLSQSVLAEKLEVTTNTVSRWETGTYKVTPVHLEKIARFFKISITKFFPDFQQSDSRIDALTSATGGLNKNDFEEVVRYAEFRRVRQVMKNSKKTKK